MTRTYRKRSHLVACRLHTVLCGERPTGDLAQPGTYLNFREIRTTHWINKKPLFIILFPLLFCKLKGS